MFERVIKERARREGKARARVTDLITVLRKGDHDFREASLLLRLQDFVDDGRVPGRLIVLVAVAAPALSSRLQLADDLQKRRHSHTV